MRFFDAPLVDLTEDDVLSLIGLPEGLTLEFKRQLDIDTPEQKRELAKDWSAMANADGGRLIYGLDEDELSDGSRVASAVAPLTDKGAISRVADIVASLIQPRIRFDLKDVDVPGGFVLIVEIRPSSGLDLHMAAHPKGGRFFRRTTNGVVPMSESEVRTAYFDIGERRASLDQRVQVLIAHEAARRQEANTSFFLVPLWSRPRLIEPRLFPDLHRMLYSDVLKEFDLRNCSGLKLKHDGYRFDEDGFVPQGMTLSRRYLAVLKSGVVHWSTARPDDSSVRYTIRPEYLLSEILQVLVLGRYMLGSAGYRGAVRLIHRVRCPGPWILYPYGDTNEAGTLENTVSDFDLESSRETWGAVIKELLDPYFHASGKAECPFIGRDGVVPVEHAEWFPTSFDRYLRIRRT